MEVINLELILSDLEQIDRRLQKAQKDKKTPPEELSALTKVAAALNAGKLEYRV